MMCCHQEILDGSIMFIYIFIMSIYSDFQNLNVAIAKTVVVSPVLSGCYENVLKRASMACVIALNLCNLTTN